MKSSLFSIKPSEKELEIMWQENEYVHTHIQKENV